MHRRETERTTRMNRDELMTADQEQAITARIRLTDIRAAQARDHAVTTPMPSRVSEAPLWVPPARKQTLRMGALLPTAAHASSDASVQTPMLAVGSRPALQELPPARRMKGAMVSFAVAASILIAFFAVYACI